MTVGEFKNWCEEEGVTDDATISVYDTGDFFAPLEPTGLEAEWDPDCKQTCVRINLNDLED
jgi:hypothetical protein